DAERAGKVEPERRHAQRRIARREQARRQRPRPRDRHRDAQQPEQRAVRELGRDPPEEQPVEEAVHRPASYHPGTRRTPRCRARKPGPGAPNQEILYPGPNAPTARFSDSLASEPAVIPFMGQAPAAFRQRGHTTEATVKHTSPRRRPVPWVRSSTWAIS